jgi:uncharacterized protein (DUF58 family)
MVSAMDQAQKFLDPKTVSLISNYRLLARLIVDGFFIGQHRGPRHAFSLEYSKHREYYPGDSLKMVDWKLYGKSDRFFVKQFEEETNLESWMLMDTSKSMDYQGAPGAITKLRYASYLASALSYLLLGQKDLVGLMLFDRKIKKIIPPSAALRQLNIILREMKTLKAGGVSKFQDSARLVASRVKKRGLLVLFSDLLAQPEDVEKTLKQFLHKGNELIVFHILSPEELQFPFRKFGYFEDLETKKRILLQPDSFKKEYRKQMENYLETVKKTCMKLRISYQMLQTNTPFDVAMRTFLESRARMH